MELKYRNILILGLGISGVSTAKALNKLNVNIIISDRKKEDELKPYIDELRGIKVKYVLGTNDVDLDNIDLIIKSPGIPLNLPIISKAVEKGIEVITDIELAYRISSNQFIAITGTNGKTTTTTLIGEVFKNANKVCHVTGNVGVGILWKLINSNKNDIFVVEVSSFQLESTKYFKPKASVILNITPDHLKWHGSFDNYINAKKKIFANQDKDDYTILNYDDKLLRKLSSEVCSNIIFFSQCHELENGVYVKDNKIVVNDGKKIIPVISCNEIKIPGKHNLENALAAVSVGWVMGVDLEVIADTLRNFEGVEHRLEFVDEINGVSFYNDSKATNPDAAIKAIEAIESPIILIAGGLDKGNEFDEFISSFNNKVKELILLGETAIKIKDAAIKLGFRNIHIVENMEKAVEKSYELAKSGDNVLLSPACASWDMYKNFEERGKDFKRAVNSLRGLNNDKKESL
ncbi:UDP-N-acetylmuramoyl-L-alanyl-D-glutamate synthetase [Caloranaerobacter sp. TR13]|uniref:UDP-N-acetylmuramoyl-L-alanine--D-glutamate ligase n=1 Tax=Caloranaerobacter sp. TR13 TaxID=1302151 RepID=UPI0006D3EFAE|nr:UDP-N-acetylmuramoyl-L-alanine--D-glutamate ligase [Caloranaerobacter sp. TR13]KPU28323.1 UDP-N-acetylmuramoyl-L-alanyl-D-glutamate synthetase [Caloranaerobacter sp. TR13]